MRGLILYIVAMNLTLKIALKGLLEILGEDPQIR